MGFVDNMKEKIDNILGPNHEKAYKKFSENQKKEMLESLKLKDSIDLYGLDFSHLGEATVDSKGDTVDFKKGVVKKDEIGKYIMLNGIKCRKYQPGISGFVYKDIRNRYNENRLIIGFCDKGNFKKHVTIDGNGEIESVKMPKNLEKKLGGPFYSVSSNTVKGELYNISRGDVYSDMEENGSNSSNGFILSKNWEQNEGGKSININGINFRPFKEGISGFIYQEFSASGYDKQILLAEYKDGKMIGGGIILGPAGKDFIMDRDNVSKLQKK